MFFFYNFPSFSSFADKYPTLRAAHKAARPAATNEMIYECGRFSVSTAIDQNSTKQEAEQVKHARIKR